MRSRVAALFSILTALVALTLVGAAAPAVGATMCPYTVSQATNTRQSPSYSSPATGQLQAGTVYYFSSPLVTSSGWVKYRTNRWVAPGLVHRYNGRCLN